MPRNRKTKSYPAEFRDKAIRLVTETGYTFEDVAKQLGCGKESIRRWLVKYKQEASPETAAKIEQDQSETKRLRKRVAQLEQENDFLKKAAAYFAKESQ
jgi:transposase